jgi:polar amino acid transport system substrate-binding protein
MAGIVHRPKPLSIIVIATLAFVFAFVAETYAANPPFRVAYKTDNPFYQFTNGQGIADGINVDLMNAIARENHIDVEYVPMEKLWDCIKALDEGNVDIVLGVPSSAEGPFMSSMETITITISMLSRNDVLTARDRNTYSSYTALLEYNTANISLISNIAASTYIVTGSQKELLLKYLSGEGDLMICDLNCIMYLVRQYGVQEKFSLVQGNIGTVGYVTAVRKGNVTLLRLINDGLMRLRLNGEYDRIRAKWIPENPDPKGLIARIIRIVLAAASIAILGVFAFILVSTRIRNHLKKEVKEKTKELDLRITQLQSESDLRNRIIERSPNGIILFDRDGKVTLVNSSACRIMNYPTPPVGMDIMGLPLFGHILKKHEGEGFVGEHQVSNNMYSLTRSNGLHKLYQYSILPIMDGGVYSSALITVEDITVDEKTPQDTMK